MNVAETNIYAYKVQSRALQTLPGLSLRQEQMGEIICGFIPMTRDKPASLKSMATSEVGVTWPKKPR